MSFHGLTNVGNFGSSALMNQKLNHAMTGSEIASLTSTQKKRGMQILCTLTESGFFANHLYVIAADDTTILDMGLRAHTHHDATDGGFLFLADRVLSGFYYHYLNYNPTAGAFFQLTGNGGTVTSTTETAGTIIDTSATSGGHATATVAGPKLSFGWPINFKVKLRVSSSTNFTQCRVGISQEHANESNTTTRKMGLEACSSSGVNWLVNSSDNTTRSTVSTSTAVAQGSHNSYTLDSTLSSINAIFGAATTMAVKTSNLPITGASGANVFRAGIKNTAAESKQVQLSGLEIMGVAEDAAWVPVTSPFG